MLTISLGHIFGDIKLMQEELLILTSVDGVANLFSDNHSSEVACLQLLYPVVTMLPRHRLCGHVKSFPDTTLFILLCKWFCLIDVMYILAYHIYSVQCKWELHKINWRIPRKANSDIDSICFNIIMYPVFKAWTVINQPKTQLWLGLEEVAAI